MTTPAQPTPPADSGTPAPAPAAAAPAKAAKRSRKVVESEGIAHISATFNNVLITITDMRGNTIAWGTAGKAGFKGSKKSTPFAATVGAAPAKAAVKKSKKLVEAEGIAHISATFNN